MDRPAQDPPASADLPVWKLEDAKARFSEVVRRARDTGPQRVTVRGQDAVVVLSAADYAKVAKPEAAPAKPLPRTLYELFAQGPFARFDDFEATLVREKGPVRDAPEF
jgi:prevent-host-death family protein